MLRRVMMKAAPVPALVLSVAPILLESLVVTPDAPAQLGFKHNRTSRVCRRRKAVPAPSSFSMCRRQHRHEEWVQFLSLIQRKTPNRLHLHLHLIVENYGTHAHPDVQA